MLLEHDFAAIVLDIQMPGMSGFELAQIIKGTKRFRQIPIMFLTAHTSRTRTCSPATAPARSTT